MYDIIILAGQSNAEGSGIGEVDKEYKPNSLVYELVDKNKDKITLDENGRLALIRPYEYTIQEAREELYNGQKRGNFAHSFGEEYIKAGKLQKGRKLLIVKTAVGGTGFAKNHWGKGDLLQDRMYQMVDYALTLNKDNKVVAFLWHQGEHDAFENDEYSYKTRERVYYEKFSYLINGVRDKYGNEFPILSAGFSAEWAKDYKEQCKAVISATKRVLKEYGGSYVSVKGLKSNNQDSGNGDTIHFCRKSLYELGKRYFKSIAKED